MSRLAQLALAGALCPLSTAHAAPPIKDADGGFSLHAWFSREEVENLGIDDADEGAFCALMQDASNRLYLSSEGGHYIKNATFMVGENQPGIRFFAGPNGKGIANFHGRLAMPLSPDTIFEADLQTFHHELGHYLYGFADEYLRIENSGFGFCEDYDSTGTIETYGCTSVPSSTCESGAACIVPNMCDGGTHHGQICTPEFANTALYVNDQDCAGSGGTCLPADLCLFGSDAKASCATHADCAGTNACSAELESQVAVDVPVGLDSCLMAAQFDESRWCSDTHHQHTMGPNSTFPNGFSLDQSFMIDGLVEDAALSLSDASDYSCWHIAEHRYADLHFPGDYSDEADLGSPPPMESCVWAVDPIDPDGSTAILIDTSGSMAHNDAYVFAADGASFFYDEASPNLNQGYLGLYGFDTNFIERPYPIDMDALDTYMEVERNTHMCNALEDAGQILSSQGLTDRKIIILTDGKDTTPAGTCDPIQVAADLCNDQGISVHALAYGAADVATTQAMTHAGCGVSKLVGKDTPGMSRVHALQLGFARMSAAVRSEIELLYERQDVQVGPRGDIVSKSLVVPELAGDLTLTWMGDDPTYEPVFNQSTFTVTTPTGTVHTVSGDTAADRARYRSITFDDPEPGEWTMTIDGTTATLYGIDVEVGWFATMDAPSLNAEAWVLEPTGVVGQYTTILASVSRDHEPLTGLIADAEVYIEGIRLPLPLYDDGQHGDLALGDGVYGARFMPGEEGAHGVDVTFSVLSGETRGVATKLPIDEDFELRADTAFQAAAVEPVVGLGSHGVPLELPYLYQGSTVTGLHSGIWGVPLSPADITLSLGPGIDIQNVAIDCVSCGLNDRQEYEFFFDAVVAPDAELGLRDLVVQSGTSWYRLEDATTVLPTFGSGKLVITEVMPQPSARRPTQWFEVHNPSDRQVDLEGVVVENRAGESFTIAAPTPVPAEGFVQIVLDDLELDADDDSIGLRSDGELVDVVGYNVTKSPMGYGVSMNLDPDHYDATDNDDTESWCASVDVFDAYGQLGTPGGENTPCGPSK